MKTTVRLDYEQWVKEFQPIVVDASKYDINKYLIDGAIPEGTDPRCIWSFVEGDGVEGIVEGVHEGSTTEVIITQFPAIPDVSYIIDYFIEGPEPDWSEIDPDLLY